MSLDEAEAADGRENPGKRPSGGTRPGKVAVRQVGRPQREKIINSEDLLNLKITLQSTRTVDEFLARC